MAGDIASPWVWRLDEDQWTVRLIDYYLLASFSFPDSKPKSPSLSIMITSVLLNNEPIMSNLEWWVQIYNYDADDSIFKYLLTLTE